MIAAQDFVELLTKLTNDYKGYFNLRYADAENGRSINFSRAPQFWTVDLTVRV